MKKQIKLLVAAMLGTCLSLQAQVVKPKSVLDGQPEPLWDLTYRGTPLQNALDMYGQITGRIVIKAPNVSPITLDLVSEEKLPETEVLLAIETALELNNISLVPQGSNFIIVKTADSMLQGPGALKTLVPNEPFPEDSTMIQQIIELKHITPAELQPVIQGMLHPYAKVQGLERTNSILLIDTKFNVQRVLDILKLIDVPAVRTEEQRIYQIQFAQATEIAAKLQEIIAEAVAENERNQAAQARTGGTSVRTTTPTRTSPPGVIRARTGAAAAASPTSASFDLSGDASSRGLITGKPQIVADERTNILIIISRPENYPFFSEMIEVLDTKVDPEITFKNIRLEYADAEELAGIINELIGAASRNTQTGAGANPATTRTGGATDNTASRSATTIRDFINNQNRTRTTPQAAQTASTAAAAAGGSLGQISENTQIIADPRTNSILIMGRNEDIRVLQEVVMALDIMLDQVLIEAVILEVSLNDNISYGVDWLQRSLTVANTEVLGPRGGINSSTPIAGFGGGSRQNGSTFIDGANVTRDLELADGALSYFATFYDLNLDAVLTLASGSSDARVLSTPVVLTTDNTEANIIVGERRPIPTATQQGLGTGVSRTSVDYENIGIELKVTPRINPQGFVVMEIEQSADNVGGNVVISGDEFPIITTRQLQASIAVQNRQTIVLGGLVAEDTRESRTKVPIIGDFPILGTFFKSERDEKNRTELLVLITPYVMSSIEDSMRETERLFHSTKGAEHKRHGRWSDSSLNTDKDAVPPLSRFRYGARKAKAEKAAALAEEARAEVNGEAAPMKEDVLAEPALMAEPAPTPVLKGSSPADRLMNKGSRFKGSLLAPAAERVVPAAAPAPKPEPVLIPTPEPVRVAPVAPSAELNDARMQRIRENLRVAKEDARKAGSPKSIPDPDNDGLTGFEEEPAPVFPSPTPIPTTPAAKPAPVKLPAIPVVPPPKIPAVPAVKVPAIPAPTIPPPKVPAPVTPKALPAPTVKPKAVPAPTVKPQTKAAPTPKPLPAAAQGQAPRKPSPVGSIKPIPRPAPGARLKLPVIGTPNGVPTAPQIAPAPPAIPAPAVQKLDASAPPPRALNQTSSKKLILKNPSDK